MERIPFVFVHVQPNHGVDGPLLSVLIDVLRHVWMRFHLVALLQVLSTDAWQAKHAAWRFRVPRKLVKPFLHHPRANRGYGVDTDFEWSFWT